MFYSDVEDFLNKVFVESSIGVGRNWTKKFLEL